MHYLYFFVFFIFLVAGLPLQGWAQSNTSWMEIPEFRPEQKKDWGLKLEFDGKTTDDKSHRTDGFTSEMDIQFRKAITDEWSGVFGGEVDQKQKRGKPTTTKLETLKIGLRRVDEILLMKWRSQFTYDPLINEDEREEQSRNGYLSADLKGHAFLGEWGKLKIRLRHHEYLITRSAPGVDLRQSKLEVSPEYRHDRFAIGIKNVVSHHWSIGEETNSFDFGPFVKYEMKRFEAMLKIIFSPVDDSITGFKTSENWEKYPRYGLEIEMNL